VHTLSQEENSILSVATGDDHIYSGSQNQSISVRRSLPSLPSFSLARVLTRLTCRSGTVVPIPSRHNLEDTQAVCSLSNMRRINTGYLARQVCFRLYSMISANHRIDHRRQLRPCLYSISPHRPASRSLSLTQQVWDTKELTPLYVINPFLDTDSGDLFSLAWSSTLSTIYVGCQNTSLQWYNFRESRDSLNTPSQQSSGTSTPRLAHKFFNSYPRSQRRSPDFESSNGINKTLQGADGHVVFANPPAPRAEFSIPAQNVIDSAHYGYVYCMVLLPSTCQGTTSAVQKDVVLATGSGDETVKVCVTYSSLACMNAERISGLEVLAQRARAPYYHRVHSWRRSIPRHAGGSIICGLPGRIRSRLGHANQDVRSHDHRSGGERSPACRSTC